MGMLSAAAAQSRSPIAGTVTDSSGAAVFGATVRVRTGSLERVQSTNRSGQFSFADINAKAATLSVSAAGFTDTEVEWRHGTTPIQIILRPATVAQQVTVTANRMGSRVVGTPTSLVVLSSQDVASTAAYTVDDMLRQVPGFTLFRRTSSRTSNPTSQGVSLRGLGASGASRALVLADGFPLNDPFGGWVYWDRVPREDISHIEVASGGASHLYGLDALGGVINIFRKPMNVDALSFELAGGKEDSPDLSLAGTMRIGPWSYLVHSDLFRTDGYIAVASNLRGAVDTPVNSQDATGDLTVQRKFGEDRKSTRLN